MFFENFYLAMFIEIHSLRLFEDLDSRTPDRDFRCFYPCEIILSHTPVPALGKGKK